MNVTIHVRPVALAKSVISTIVKWRKKFLRPHRNYPTHPDQVTAMNNHFERCSVSAPAVPGFETLFGLIPFRPIERKPDAATDAFDAFLKREKTAEQAKLAIHSTDG